MLLIPAIDLKDGGCVRLRQGDMNGATVYSDQPGDMAKQWLDQGARRLHIVDLNGAVAGKPKNEPAIKDIVRAIGDRIPIQLGGGIRDLDTIERYLDDGVSYVDYYCAKFMALERACSAVAAQDRIRDETPHIKRRRMQQAAFA